MGRKVLKHGKPKLQQQTKNYIRNCGTWKVKTDIYVCLMMILRENISGTKENSMYGQLMK
jgi:hypothetical protein